MRLKRADRIRLEHAQASRKKPAPELPGGETA
jgi:hypothetical protein